MMARQKYSILVIAASLLLAGCAAEQPSSPEAQYASHVCGDSAVAGGGINEALNAFAVNFAGGNYAEDKQREVATCRLQAMAQYQQKQEVDTASKRVGEICAAAVHDAVVQCKASNGKDSKACRVSSICEKAVAMKDNDTEHWLDRCVSYVADFDPACRDARAQLQNASSPPSAVTGGSQLGITSCHRNGSDTVNCYSY